MQSEKAPYCFSGIVGQEDMKSALIFNAVNPNLGGVLIRGEKGTAKSTAARALAALLPSHQVVDGCPFGCDPQDEAFLCPSCQERRQAGETLPTSSRPMRVVDLPVSATEDRVVGSLDIEHAIKTGEKKFEPGILARANRNILYVDEVNLLEDHVVDVLLDSAAMGVNTVEREGVSYSHPARFILVGTMNPEEGDLRPQLLDRFGLSVTVRGEKDVEERVKVVKNRLMYENEPEEFFATFQPLDEAIASRILAARRLLPKVRYSAQILTRIARIAIALEVDGHRADISTLKTAITAAAYDGRDEVNDADVTVACRLALPHRMRRLPFEDVAPDIGALIEAL